MVMHVGVSGRGGGRDHIDGMKHRSDLALLHRSELFRDLPFEVLGEIRSLASSRQAASGHVIFHQGDDAATLYIVLDGRFRSAQVTPEGEQVIIRYLGPGELMGFAVLASQETCATTVTSLMESSLLAWSGPIIEQIIRRYPVVATNALLVMAGATRKSCSGCGNSRLRESSGASPTRCCDWPVRRGDALPAASRLPFRFRDGISPKWRARRYTRSAERSAAGRVAAC